MNENNNFFRSPSSGKTSVIIKLKNILKEEKIGVVKFDSLSTSDKEIYDKYNIESLISLSGNLCPDHFFISNIEDCVNWGNSKKLDYLIIESAGLCNRCSPHFKDHMAICIIDNLSGINTPKKIGPMLKYADLIVVTKGDIVSQSEREVFSFKIGMANPKANILFINGITGQGAFDLGQTLKTANDLKDNNFNGSRLRFTMPAAVCSYCLGEVRVGEKYQKGNIKK